MKRCIIEFIVNVILMMNVSSNAACKPACQCATSLTSTLYMLRDDPVLRRRRDAGLAEGPASDPGSSQKSNDSLSILSLRDAQIARGQPEPPVTVRPGGRVRAPSRCQPETARRSDSACQ